MPLDYNADLKTKNKKIIVALLLVIFVLTYFIFSVPPQRGLTRSENENEELAPPGSARFTASPGSASFTASPGSASVMRVLDSTGLDPISADPQIAVYGNSTYVIWRDNSSGNDEIYAKISPAGKTNPSRTSNLSRNNGSSVDPQIAVYGNSTYVVWRDNSSGNDEIHLKLSPAGKADFGRVFNLSRNNGSSVDPQIAVYGNSTYVVWRDNSTGANVLRIKSVTSIT